MRWSISPNTTSGLALAVALLALGAIVGYFNIRSIQENERVVVHTHEVLDSLRLVFSDIAEAANGQRGYLIVGDPAYLQPYEKALRDIDQHLTQLRKLVADNPEQVTRAEALATAVDARLASLKRGIELLRSEGRDAAEAHIRTGLGKTQHDAIRDLVNEMVGEEERLLAERSEETRAGYRTAFFTTGLTTLVGMVLVGLVYGLALKQAQARERMTEELERLVTLRTTELNQTNDALRVSNRELEQFASVASHDLQEPLRKIEAFGDRLKSRNMEQLDDNGRDYLERVLVSASRMRSLINDLLNFSRVTTRAQPPQPVNLQTVAEEVTSDLEGRLQQTGGRVELGKLPTVEADPTQMRQLLQNLIGNALKFHRPEVPPVVKVNARNDLSEKVGPSVVITVEDNGIGFEEVYLDRIFNVFQRLHGRNEYEGTGMGLAIARKIVERHQGTITAHSRLDEGSTFIVTLPLTQPKKDMPI
ncbi:MAG: CHASE3 domain-containing protein [Pirellulales bacterium]